MSPLEERAWGLARALARRLRPGEERRRLLVVGSGRRAARAYILEAFRRRGLSVTLLAEKPTWERSAADVVRAVDLSDPAAALRVAREEHLRRPLGGCLTYLETEVPLAARIAAELGLRFLGPVVAERVRDKRRMRECLRQAGLPMPRSVPVGDDLPAAVAQVGLPAVLKPVRGEGSIHVFKLESVADVAAARGLCAASRQDPGWRYGDYLLEEYVDGEEYSVESLVAGGRVHHVAMTDKYKGPEPFFEEVSHTVPTLLPAAEVEEALGVAGRAIAALGLDDCAVHTELKTSSRGTVVMEVAGRLAGDRIPSLVELARGVDLAGAAGGAALGLPVSLSPSRARYASVGFFVPAREQVQQRDLRGRPEVPGVTDFEFWGRAGQRWGVPPSHFFTRIGLVIAVADGYRQSRERIEAVRRFVAARTGLELVPFPVQGGVAALAEAG